MTQRVMTYAMSQAHTVEIGKISLLNDQSKEMDMAVMARVTSKGQVTIPKKVREALGISPGDAVLFRIESERAVMQRIPDLIELAGSVEVPPEKRDIPWEEVLAQAHEAWAREAMDIDES